MVIMERQIKILNYLKEKKDWTKGSELAAALDVTDRTIRNDIIAIKDVYGDDIINAVRTKGYKIGKLNHGNEVEPHCGGMIMNKTDRVLFILKTLLITNEKISIYNLAEQLFVSESTLEADLVKLKKTLNDLEFKEVTIIREGEFIRICGHVNTLSNILYEVARYFIVDLKLSDLNKIFSHINLEVLSTLVKKVLNQNKYHSRYLSIIRFVLDIALICEAEKLYCHDYGDPFKGLIERPQDFDEKQYDEMVEVISEELGKECNLSIQSNSLKYLSYNLYINNKIEEIETEIRNSNIVEDDIYNFCINIFNKKSDNKWVEFNNNKELIHNLMIYLKLVIKRAELGIKLYNPLMETIRNEYPYLLDFAIEISQMILEKYNISLDFNEVSYIGVYLATALQDIIDEGKDEKLKILLYIPEGPGNLSLMEKQINNFNMNKNFKLVGTTNLAENYNIAKELKEYDLIISTCQWIEGESDKVIIIERAFDLFERNRVKDRINKAILYNEESKFMMVCNLFFNEAIFVKDMKVNTKEQAIIKLCNLLKENGYVDDSYVNQVLEREEVASTALDCGVALPHSIKDNAKQYGMAVAILKDTVNWEGKKVKMVFLFSNGSRKLIIDNDFFNRFMNIIILDSFVEEGRKCNSLKEFMAILRKYFVLTINN